MERLINELIGKLAEEDGFLIFLLKQKINDNNIKHNKKYSVSNAEIERTKAGMRRMIKHYSYEVLAENKRYSRLTKMVMWNGYEKTFNNRVNYCEGCKYSEKVEYGSRVEYYGTECDVCESCHRRSEIIIDEILDYEHSFIENANRVIDNETDIAINKAIINKIKNKLKKIKEDADKTNDSDTLAYTHIACGGH